MNIDNGTLHLIKAAIDDFRRNKVRTFLTSLGIMIGVLSVVMLIAIGTGLKNYLEQTFENMGANLIMVMPGSGFGGEGAGFAGAFVGGIEFDEKDVNSLSRLSNVKYTVPLYFKSSLVESASNEEYLYIEGVNSEFFELMNLELIGGVFFSESDVQARAKVGVMGETAAEDLFGNAKDAVGKTVRFDNQRFKVIGVVENIGDQEQDNSIAIPYKTTYGNMNPDKTFWTIYLGVESEDDVPSVKEKVEEVLEKRYEEDDFSVIDQTELLSTVNEVFNIVNGVLVAIGSISLLVGGIGIMNIMYATVTERIKEVGIRRAVGATEQDILNQFLTEAVLLSLFGGILGLTVSGIIVVIVHPFFPIAINAFAVVITLTISSAIGIFFGVFPARRAAKLPPIEAIRYE